MVRSSDSVTGRALAGALALAVAACSGGSPAGPGPQPSPSPTGSTVVAVVFYDENGNGRLETDEAVRVPDVEVSIGGRSARTERLTGRAVVTGVPDGTQAASVRSETLPPFFRAGAPVSTPVPPAPNATLLIPLTLPLSDLARPNVYMAFGDSITRGDGSAQGGYPPLLESLLRAHFAGAQVINHGRDSTNSFEGRDRIRRNLRLSFPAYTLILYGTNDWHAQECQADPQPPRCPTVDNLRLIVEEVKDFGSLPFLALLPPVNPALNPEGRNQWNRDVNVLLRSMAAQEGAFVVDLNQAFARQGDLPRLFSDHVHPNDAGYRVMADSFFEAIAHGRSSPAAAGGAFRGP